MGLNFVEFSVAVVKPAFDVNEFALEGLFPSNFISKDGSIGNYRFVATAFSSLGFFLNSSSSMVLALASNLCFFLEKGKGVSTHS